MKEDRAAAKLEALKARAVQVCEKLAAGTADVAAWRAERDAIAVELLDAGLRQFEVARIFGVTDQAVAFVVAKAKKATANGKG